jgi:hypothetical protein
VNALKLAILRESVHEALDSAVDNGYEFMKTWPAGALAEDLLRYAGHLEHLSIDALLPHVEEWLTRNPCS